MDQNYSTKHGQHPDWLVQGLVRSAAFAEDERDTPIFNTGMTFNQLKARVRTTLEKSGLDLSKTELSQGTHWLTSRIAQNVGPEDTADKVEGYFNDFVFGYLADKTMQRLTGVHQRTPIYTREWWDQHMKPPEQVPDEPPHPPAPGGETKTAASDMDDGDQRSYIAIDGDNIGHLVEDSLLTDDPSKAEAVSLGIHEAHNAIVDIVRDRGGRVIFDGGDNMLVYMQFDPQTTERFRSIYRESTGHSATIGVGHRPVEAHYSLVVGKNTGKDKTVVYDQKVKDEYERIHAEQEKLAPQFEKLKYRAQAIDRDVEAAPKIIGAMKELGLDINDEAVYDVFLRLVERFGLQTIEQINQFFSDERETIKQSIREVWASRLDWTIKVANRKLTEFEITGLASELGNFIDVVRTMSDKFEAVVESLGPEMPELRALSNELRATSNRCAQAIVSLSESPELVYSQYFDDVARLSSETRSMTVPIDQELEKALRAAQNSRNSEPGRDLEFPINASPLIDVMTKLVSRIGLMALALEMTGVVSAASPMIAVASAGSEPQSFPGQTVVPTGTQQRSPHKRMDWLTLEEYNKDQVDWSKTDDQYVSTNVPRDSQMMVGGDPGNPIYVP